MYLYKIHKHCSKGLTTVVSFGLSFSPWLMKERPRQLLGAGEAVDYGIVLCYFTFISFLLPLL